VLLQRFLLDLNQKKFITTVLYTSPEIAQVGDVFAKEKVAKFPYRADSRARISGESEFFVKFAFDMNEKIVSMTVVGHNAGEANVKGAIEIENGLSIDAIVNTVHPHPSLSESVIEAAKMIKNTQIHI
jgi:dihydrolipoamide dehydrogenase